ncbi:MAG TPA: ABC transporter permease [Gemmatimonadaceae bacterium]|jgi:putative ABC transport system permease protein
MTHLPRVTIGETVAVAFDALRVNVLRSTLTALGIIIGVGAVITMVALGTGAQKAVNDQIAALGANLLTITPGQSFARGVASATRVSLTTDDADSLVSAGRLLTAVVPAMQGQLQLQFGARNINTTVIGTTANYVAVQRVAIADGRSFTDGDDGARQRYVVLGSQVPELLGSSGPAMLQQTVLLNGIPFEIIGVLTPRGAQGGFANPDEQITIPLETARHRVLGTDRLRSISVQVDSTVPAVQGMIDIERVLRRRHHIRPGQDNDFQISSPQQLMTAQQTSASILTTLLASIAAVSLVVGGIGIMNIMLVSVSERTREIGLRKAVGATRTDILVQFLTEALMLCFAGGLLGITLGAAASLLLGRTFHWNMLISPRAVGLSFGFSALVGAFFGLWPARRAARLDPIAALRYE